MEKPALLTMEYLTSHLRSSILRTDSLFPFILSLLLQSGRLQEFFFFPPYSHNSFHGVETIFKFKAVCSYVSTFQ